MGANGWGPRTGEDWFRWVEGELRQLKRHRHNGANFAMPSGSMAQMPTSIMGPEGEIIEIVPGAGEYAQTGVFEQFVRDETPPPQPSTPTVTNRAGTITLLWDGMAAQNQPMPPDLMHVAVYRSQEGAEFDPSVESLVGFIQPGGGTFVMPDQDYGSLWFYRLVAFDRDENMSPPSTAVSATTAPTVTGDLAQDLIDDIMTGVNGAALASTSIQSYQNEYAVSASDTVAPTTGWSTDTPVRTPGTYIWFRTTVTYGDNTTSTTSPALLTGNDGSSTPGPVVTLTATSQILVSPAAGGATTPATAVVSGMAANTTITAWTYSVDGGAFSATVPAGVSRTDNVVTITGATVTAATIAVKMADADGVHDILTVAKVYEGADGTDGSDGRGIASSVVEYQASSSGTTPPTGTWTASPPAASPGQYVWTRITTTYTDATTSTAYAVGRYGSDGTPGDDGVGVDSAVVTYQLHTLGTTAPTGTWLSTVPDMTEALPYLWTRVVTTYTDASTSTNYSVSRRGDDGTDGRGITGTVTTYQASSSGTDVPTGTWLSSPPAASPGQYIWTRTITSYTDATTSTAYSVGRYGSDGTPGDDGVGVASSVVTYQIHNSGTSAPTGTWNASVQDTTDANPYLWTRTVITYTDASTSTVYAVAYRGLAYTVVLSNEAHTFPGDVSNALAGSTTSAVRAYKGGTQIAATIGTITGQVTGLTTSIQNNGTTTAQFTVTVTTSLVTQSGVLTVPITVDGKSFTKFFSWTVAYKGTTGGTGPTGKGITSVTPYFQQTASGAAAPAKPTTNPPPAPWTTTEPGYVADTALWRTERIVYTDATFAYTDVTKVSAYTAAVSAQATADGKNTVTYSNAGPGSTANKAGDTWFVFSGTQITEVWKGNGGTSWTQQTITSSAITNLDAGVVTAGFLSTDRLLANSVGIEKLAVGDLSNFIEINETRAPSVINTGAGGTHVIENVGGTLWSKRSVITGTEFYLRNTRGPIPFEAGARLRIRMTAYSDTATNGAFFLHTYDSTGAYLQSQQIGDTFAIGVTATSIVQEGTVGAAVMPGNAAQFLLTIGGLTANRTVRIRNARAYEMNAGELLVDGSVVADSLAANSVTSDKMVAGSVTADKLESILILASTIASAQTGRRWEADQYGIRLYETDGSALINLPTDPDMEATFHGDVLASSITVQDRLALRGLTNEISRGAVLTLAAGATAPSTPPTVFQGVPAESLSGIPTLYSNGSEPGQQRGLAEDSSYWYTSGVTTDGKNWLWRYSRADKTRDTSWEIEVTPLSGDSMNRGVTILGGNIYTIGASGSTETKVVGYSISTKAKVQEWVWSPFSSYGVSIGNDGTNLLIAGYRDSTSRIEVVSYSVSGTQGTIRVTNSTHQDRVTSVLYGSFDFGGTRIIVTFDNYWYYPAANNMRVFADVAGTWTNQTNETWLHAPSQTTGMVWDSPYSRFVDFSGNVLWMYSGVTWTTESSTWWASNTWYDSNATNGTHETTQGPRTKFTALKRRGYVFTAPPLPPRPDPNTVDDILRPRFYLGRGASDPTRTGMWLQSEVADGANSNWLFGITFSGTNPPSTNNFTGSAPGILQATDPAKFIVKGDGSGLWHGITADTTSVRVTKTAKTETPTLLITGLSSSSLTANTSVNIDWSSTPDVNDDGWTTSNAGLSWACPRNGTYAIIFNAVFSSVGAAQVGVDTKNGTRYIYNHKNSATGYNAITVVYPAARMEVGDTIACYVRSTGTEALGSGTFLEVTRIGGE